MLEICSGEVTFQFLWSATLIMNGVRDSTDIMFFQFFIVSSLSLSCLCCIFFGTDVRSSYYKSRANPTGVGHCFLRQFRRQASRCDVVISELIVFGPRWRW